MPGLWLHLGQSLECLLIDNTERYLYHTNVELHDQFLSEIDIIIFDFLCEKIKKTRTLIRR